MRLGRLKHAIFLAVFLLLAASSSGQAGKNFRYQLGGLPAFDVITENQSVIIHYSISELNIENAESENGSFYRISVPGHIHSSFPGKPELPVFSRLIKIPEESEYSVKITDVKTTTIKPSVKKFDGLLYPAQESETKNDPQAKAEFRIDKSLYSRKGFLPDDTVTIQHLGKVRSNSMANLFISPVKYNPRSNVMEVITSMKIVITFDYKGDQAKTKMARSLLVNESLSKGVMNYNPEDVITGYTDLPVGMVIITDTSFRKQLQPFIRWKTQKGFRLKILYKGASFAGDDYTALKDTLNKIYIASSESEPPPEYLLIVGNTNKVPSYGSGNLTDMYYGEFDGGGDYIPDMYIGRLPVADTTELKTAVKKIIQYEKFEFADTNKFYSEALATTGYDLSYANYMDGQVKYAITNYLTPANRIKEHHFYNQTSTTSKDSVIRIINKGVSFINYTGHGDATGWLHLNVKTGDTSRLTNKYKYPFIISNACRTAQFNITGSFGNRMVLSADKGAIGFIGCSNDSYWDEDFYWAVGNGVPSINATYENTGRGAYDRLFHTHQEPASEWYYTMGQINFSGNLSVSASTSQRKKYYWETYNLIGDPSLIPMLGTPQNLNITIPDTLPNGIRSWSFNSKPFTYVAISHFDTLWDASFASTSGAVVLEIPDVKNDSCLLVITGQNIIPVIKKIYLTNVKSEFVNLSSTTINDSLGNGNNMADYGESVFLKLKIGNQGSKNTDGLYARIKTTSEWITINNDSAYIGTLNAGSEITLRGNLGFTVSELVPDRGIATIQLILKDKISEKSYNIDIPLHSPELKIVNFTMDDSAFGNGDRVADPGETYQLIFKVLNEGSSDVSGNFYVTSQNSHLTIIDSDIKSGIIKFGETTDISVTVRLSELISSGSYISLNSVLDCTPYVLDKDFVIRVGKVRESFESESFNVFPWINRSTKPWITTNEGIDGNIAARSGNISHDGTSSLIIRANYETDDSIRFFYKVSSEKNYDYFIFKLNEVEIFRKSGEISWERKSVPLNAGYNKMEWIFTMDGSTLGGKNCAWIDLIDFAVASPVKYINRDMQVARIVTPLQKDRYDQAIINVKVLNTGIDTINGFNLAYKIDNSVPYSQYFDRKLIPFGDSVTVSFKAKANMSKLGIYEFMAYGTDNNDDYLLNDTIAVKLENTEISDSLVIFPNPFSENLTVFINSRVADKLYISITDSKGAQVVITEKDVISGKNSIILDNLKFAPAVYYMNIRGSTINKTYPILKIK